eukprot:2353764-Karenia_brevis.AAC.1
MLGIQQASAGLFRALSTEPGPQMRVLSGRLASNDWLPSWPGLTRDGPGWRRSSVGSGGEAAAWAWNWPAAFNEFAAPDLPGGRRH